MPLHVWLSFAVLILATAVGAVFVVLRGIDTWQTLRSSGGRMEAAMNETLDRVARVEERAAKLEQAQPRLERSLERLRGSLEVLQIELREVQDARSSFMSVRGLVLPRK